MIRHPLLHKFLSVVLVLSFALPVAQAASAPALELPGFPRHGNSGVSAPNSGLYRTTISMRNAADRARLDKLGVVVLAERAADWGNADQRDSAGGAIPSASPESAALLPVVDPRLATLAALRVRPRAAVPPGALVRPHGPARADEGRGAQGRGAGGSGAVLGRNEEPGILPGRPPRLLFGAALTEFHHGTELHAHAHPRPRGGPPPAGRGGRAAGDRGPLRSH